MEPKTPEARAAEAEPIPEEVPPLPPKEPADAPVPRQTNNRTQRVRREKSGIPALDRYLSDGDDNQDQEAERDEDSDDDWDLIDAVDGEDRNGAKGTSLFARGVVDRYRLAVFRSRTTPQRNGARSASGMSKSSQVTVSDVTESPSPDQRRGRSSGLPFKKRPRQFLRAKSPQSSTKSSKTKSRNHSNVNTLSATPTIATGMFTPSPSLSSTLPTTPTLRSKESATSVGARSQSSGQSGNGDAAVAPDASEATKSSGTIDVPERNKTKKLRKYKENAERVFFLFSSQRQAS